MTLSNPQNRKYLILLETQPEIGNIMLENRPYAEVSYYFKPKINQLPKPIQSSVFDMQVNAGNNAIKLLQRLLIKFGNDLSVDGILGPNTVFSCHQAWRKAPDHFVDAYGIERRNYYYRIADQRPASRKYARKRDGGKGGWIKRAEHFISPRFHYSLADHMERTRKWAS